ncbi:hypothetical protein MTR67_019586, partial [Solanum verrucosum]
IKLNNNFCSSCNTNCCNSPFFVGNCCTQNSGSSCNTNCCNSWNFVGYFILGSVEHNIAVIKDYIKEAQGERYPWHLQQIRKTTEEQYPAEAGEKKRTGDEKKNKNKGEQIQKEDANKQNKANDKEEDHHLTSRNFRNQEQADQQEEEGCKTQKRKHNKQHEDKVQKTFWKPTSPQNRITGQHDQKATRQKQKLEESNIQDLCERRKSHQKPQDMVDSLALEKQKFEESDIDRVLRNNFSIRMRLGLFNSDPNL